MGYRVRLDIEGIGSLYTASVIHDSKLTPKVGEARKYHNSLNADLAAGEWERALKLLGLNGIAHLEDTRA